MQILLNSITRFNLLFLLTGAGKFNFQGTRRWLEDQLESGGRDFVVQQFFTIAYSSEVSKAWDKGGRGGVKPRPQYTAGFRSCEAPSNCDSMWGPNCHINKHYVNNFIKI